MKRSYLASILPILIALVVFAAGVGAQTEKGTIVGTVVDANGGAVAGATVEIKNLGTSTSQTLTTNDEGNFSAPFLNPGNYEVIVTASGFSRTVLSDVVVSVGSTQKVNATLKIGDVSETVTVEDAAPLVQS